MGTLGTADSRMPLCLAEFVTPQHGSGLAEACGDGNLMIIFGSKNLDREAT